LLTSLHWHIASLRRSALVPRPGRFCTHNNIRAPWWWWYDVSQ